MNNNVLNVICNRVLANRIGTESTSNVYQQLDNVLSTANPIFSEGSSDIRIGYYLKQYLNNTDVHAPKSYHLDLCSRHIIRAMAEYAMYEIENAIGTMTDNSTNSCDSDTDTDDLSE